MGDGVAGGKRRLPRFETVLVVAGGRQRFFAYDHLTKEVRRPLDPFSRVQADGLRDLMAADARKKEEPLTVERLVASLSPPTPTRPPKEPKPSTASRHKPEARSH